MCQCSRKKTAASVPALDALATLTPTAPSQCNHVTASTVAATNHCMSHDVFGAHSTGAENATPFDACADRSQSGAVSDHASGITSLNHAIEHSAAALQPSIVVTAAPADAPVDSFQPTAAALSASDDTAVAAAHALGQVQRPEVGTDACSFQTSGVAPDSHSFRFDAVELLSQTDSAELPASNPSDALLESPQQSAKRSRKPKALTQLQPAIDTTVANRGSQRIRNCNIDPFGAETDQGRSTELDTVADCNSALKKHNQKVIAQQRAVRIEKAVNLLIEKGYEEVQTRLYVEDTINTQGKQFVGKRARQALVDAVAQRIDAKSPLCTNTTNVMTLNTPIASQSGRPNKTPEQKKQKKRQELNGNNVRGKVKDGLQEQRPKQISKPGHKSRRDLPHMEWPSASEPHKFCLVGCGNEASAHFSCSHDFCSECLVGIRKFQKKKKPESDKLYAPPPFCSLKLFVEFISYTACNLF